MAGYNYFNLPQVYFHGGITFYEKHNVITQDGNVSSQLEIGCDFAHYFDKEYGQDMQYDLSYIKGEAERTIDDILSKYPMKKYLYIFEEI